MGLVADYWITNQTPEPLFIARAELVYWKWLRKRRLSQMQMRDTIPPGGTKDVRIMFVVVPPPCDEDHEFVARVILVDQLKGRHDGGKLVFRSKISGPD